MRKQNSKNSGKLGLNWPTTGASASLNCRNTKMRFFVTVEMAVLRLAQINMIEK